MDTRALLHEARLALERMQAKLAAAEGAMREPVAVVGMGCRFPGGADDPDALWEILERGIDAIGDTPSGRWDVDALYDPDPASVGRMYAREGGFLDDVTGFDAEFFGISPREARSLDPQQRMLLEVAWEALERAGMATRSLVGSRTGVFIGIAANDFAQLRVGSGDLANLDVHTGSGSGLCFAAGRISYCLGLEGPAMAVDTACSSSLVAVHLACQSLRTGECDAALAGGVNLMLSPATTVYLCRTGALSPTCRCRTFDQDADGYVRGEGCGVVVLKRLRDARRDGDRVLSVILGSAVNQDGKSGGIMVPNGRAQRAMVRDALERAGVGPHEVGFVEAHGTGTRLGDPIELGALAAVLGQGRGHDAPLRVGSIKSNLGHLEAAAGIAGLIKAILAVQRGRVPPSLHFREMNPSIPLEGVPVEVPPTTVEWPADVRGRRIAGVSSLGLSGTNAHVVVSNDPPASTPAASDRASPLLANGSRPRPAPRVLPLSAKSEAALGGLCRRYGDLLESGEGPSLEDLCFTASTRRRHHLEHRVAFVANTTDGLRRAIRAFPGDDHAVFRGRNDGFEKPRVAFLFTGHGSQHPGMGRSLFETEPVFREALERCSAIVAPGIGVSIEDLLYGGGVHGLDRMEHTQPALFALQYALSELWRSWGVRPDAVLGHSSGEYVAACVAGVFELDEALPLVVTRGRLMDSVTEGGLMAAVQAGEDQVRGALPPGGRVGIAALNSPRATVISGDTDGVRATLERLGREGVEGRELHVSMAAHSALMDPVLDRFERAASTIGFREPRCTLVSNVHGRPFEPGEGVTAAYLRRHLREPVRFKDGIESLWEGGYRVFLEIGPHATLSSQGRRCVPPGQGTWPVSVRRDSEDGREIDEAVAALYAAGVPVDWQRLWDGVDAARVDLPTYAFHRTDYPVRRPVPPHVTHPMPVPSSPGATELHAGHAYGDPICFTEVTWERQDGAEAPGEPSPGGPWTIVAAPGDGLAGDLARSVQARGGDCHVLRVLGDGGEGTEMDAIRAALSRVGAHGGPHRLLVVPGRYDPSAPIPDLASRHAEECLAAVQRTLAAAPEGGELWIVTRGAQAVEGSIDGSGLQHAPLWGLGRTLAVERPDIWGGLVDVPEVPDDRTPDAVVRTIADGTAEDEIALRSGRTWVPRVRRTRIEGVPICIRDDASYVITGGLTGLGLEVCQWLVGQGARSITLVGRRAPGESLRGRIAAWAGQGVRVEAFQGDVSRREDVDAVFSHVRGQGLPVGGVVHSAGVIEDGLVENQTAETLATTLAPKVAGTWLLHEATLGDSLDFFVCFSSQASVFGSAGQGNYAAANAFIDAFTGFRRTLGLPAQSINWGPWARVGLAAHGTVARRAGALGVIPLEPREGVGAFGLVIATDRASIGAARYDGRRPIDPGSPFWRRPVLRGFLEGAFPGSFPVTPAVHRLKQALTDPGAEVESSDVEDYVLQVVATVFGSTVAQVERNRPLVAAGLDSLMALEIRNRLEADLGVDVPLTRVLQGPSPRELSGDVRAGIAERRSAASSHATASTEWEEGAI